MRNPSSAGGASRAGGGAGCSYTNKNNSSSSSNSKTPCCSKVGLKRGPWTPEEDELLANYIKKEGEGRWRTLPKRAGLLRCGKSCRLRWMNYLRPSVKRGQIASDEEDLILRLHRLLGNRWSLIAGRIPGRTDNEIKNYWNTHLSKKLISQGIDPRTHKPLNPNSFSPQPPNAIPNHASSASPKPTTHILPTPTAPPPKPNPISTDDHQETPPAADQENGTFNVDHYQAYENLPAAMTDSDHGSAAGFRSNSIIHNEDDDDINYCSDDVLSSFLNSLINDEAFAAQHQQFQQYPPNNGIHATESSDPLITNIHPSCFGFATVGWESPILASSSALGQNDPKNVEDQVE